MRHTVDPKRSGNRRSWTPPQEAALGATEGASQIAAITRTRCEVSPCLVWRSEPGRKSNLVLRAQDHTSQARLKLNSTAEEQGAPQTNWFTCKLRGLGSHEDEDRSQDHHHSTVPGHGRALDGAASEQQWQHAYGPISQRQFPTGDSLRAVSYLLQSRLGNQQSAIPKVHTAAAGDRRRFDSAPVLPRPCGRCHRNGKAPS